MSAQKLSQKLSERFNTCINHSGMTQKELADRIHVTPVHLNNIIKGRKGMSLEIAEAAASVLGVDRDYLLGKIDYPTQEEANYQELISRPAEISSLISDILDKMGYIEFEDDFTEKDFLMAEFDMPDGYIAYSHIPAEEIKKAFSETVKNRIRPRKYRGIRRERDGKEKYILSGKLEIMFEDIENYIRYRIEQEFR